MDSKRMLIIVEAYDEDGPEDIPSNPNQTGSRGHELQPYTPELRLIRLFSLLQRRFHQQAGFFG
ncbi:hypothetical protein HUJ04_002689 [Dendroctonus ponderosae]|nr:hypothetical protein HUJ04_002689 [Dendroctonus ponderosae]